MAVLDTVAKVVGRTLGRADGIVVKLDEVLDGVPVLGRVNMSIGVLGGTGLVTLGVVGYVAYWLLGFIGVM